MFQYYTNAEYRQAYNFLNQREFLSSQFMFHHIGFIQIREAIKLFQTQQNIRFFTECFHVFKKCKGSPISMMKVLMFIHFTLQNKLKISAEINQLFIKQLNNVIEISRQYVEKQRERNFATTVNQPISEVRCGNIEKNQDERNKNKQPHKVPKRIVGMSFSSTLQTCPSLHQQCNYLQKNKIQVYSSQQVLCEKFIEPYAIYLLKESFAVNNEEEKKETLQVVNLWSSINSMNCIFKISSGISTISRYYQDQYHQLVLEFVEILDNDIKKYYGIIKKIINQKLKKISNQQEKQQTSLKKQKVQIVKNKSYSISSAPRSYDTQLMQIKQEMKQVSQINQKLLLVYCGRYIYNQLKQRDIRLPILLKPQSKQFQKIYEKIQIEDKMQEKRSKRQSSHSKSGNQKSQNSKMSRIKSFSKLNKLSQFMQFSKETLTPDRKPMKKRFRINSQEMNIGIVPIGKHKKNKSIVAGVIKNGIEQLQGEDI